MKGEASQDSIDKQAYQLGKFILFYQTFLSNSNSNIYCCLSTWKPFNNFMFQING